MLMFEIIDDHWASNGLQLIPSPDSAQHVTVALKRFLAGSGQCANGGHP
jgi:hypothetical protein